MTDTFPNAVWEVAVDTPSWISPTDDEEYSAVYVYVAVERVGVHVLRFDPTLSAGSRLAEVTIVQTPGSPNGILIRDKGSERTLIVEDHTAGIRIYEYGFHGGGNP